jgi:hypothetical protein
LVCTGFLGLACGDSAGGNDGGTDTDDDDDDDDDSTSGSATNNPTVSTTMPDPSTTMPPTTETTSGSTTEENTVLPPTISGPESTTEEVTTATTGDDMCRVEGPYVDDGGLEAGVDSGNWVETSTNFGTPICNDECGDGGSGPHNGDFWAWFGGTAAAETGGLAQDVMIPTDGETLAFFLAIPVAEGDEADNFEVSVDGDVLFSVTALDAAMYATYQRVEIDITDYADGGDHEVSFDSTTTGEVTNFMLDDVEVNCIPASTGDSSGSSSSSGGETDTTTTDTTGGSGSGSGSGSTGNGG